MAGRWYYRRGTERKLGPFTSEELKRLAASGELRPDDRVWKEGKRKWVAARKVQRLFDSAGVPSAEQVVIGEGPSTRGSSGAAVGSAPVSARPAEFPAAVELPAAARFERTWLDWRAGRGRRTGSASAALGFVAALVDQLEPAEQLQLNEARPSSRANPLLNEIARTLPQLGFTPEGAVEWLAGQEKLHADYYDGLRREKGLKALLGQIAHFQDTTDGLYDGFARAYGAQRLLDTIERHRLSSRHLADSGDRDTFNKQIDRAAELCRKLPSHQRLDMENFEKVYAAYHWLARADPEAQLRQQRREVPASAKPGASPPAIPCWELGSFWSLLAMTLFWTFLLLMVCVLGVADDDPPPGGYAAFVCVLDAFPVIVTSTVFLLARRRYRRALALYNEQRATYQQSLARTLKDVRALRSEVLAHNEAIDKRLPTVRHDHAAAVSSLRELINDSLVAHPQLSTFVSAV